MTFFLLKNKTATPIPGRFSAAFAAGAVPSIHVNDMQHEGQDSPTPFNTQQARESLGREVIRLSMRWQVTRVFVVPKIFSSCSPVLLLQL